MPNLPLLVVATRNRKKGLEVIDLLAPLGLRVETLAEYPDVPPVEESGDTFADNAALKALEIARRLGCWALGEDSGLVVDALGGAPGVCSARFAGPEATDDANNRLLLEKLGDLPPERRAAHYVCHATLADPQGQIRAESEAICRGRIRSEPAGTGGFGYDPLFEIVEYHRTFGELGTTVKSVLSHRARAMTIMAEQMARLLQSGAWAKD